MNEERRVIVTAAQRAADTNYAVVAQTLRDNKGAEAKAIRAMLGGDKALFERFLATTFALLARHPDILADATPASLVQSIKDAASMGLEPMTSDGAIIVRKGVATFSPMWQGYLKRIRNTRAVQDIDVQLVYTGDSFEYGYTERGGTFKHLPVKEERGSYWGAYAYAVMPSGFVELEVMTVADLNHVRDNFSEGRPDNPKNPWNTSWGEMARKTVIRRLAKRLPASAVDALLAADARADDMREEVASKASRDDLAEVRALALQAVGALAPGETPTPDQTDGSPLAEGQAEPTQAAAPKSVNPHDDEWGPLDGK